MQIVLDVSAFQSVAQLDQLLRKADDEIVAVYIKATQGLSYGDALAAAFAKCCMSHDTAFAYYDFMTNDDASAQEKDFASFVAPLPEASCVPMTDCEGAYAKFAAGVENWELAYGRGVITYAQLSNMPRYAAMKTPKWVAQYDSTTYYRPSQAEMDAYAADGYLLWQFTSNYMGLNQDASVLLGDFELLKAS